MHENDYWQRLLYRWFVQYNPLYLVSAMLVLGGTILTSRGLALEGSLNGQLGVSAVAELYAALLIGGAALLTRINQRRPAVMLAALTALYQCDLTLHTETCVQLGTIGVVASVAWLAIFGGKLAALAWAVKARLSRGAYAVALTGAAALTFGPYLVERANAAASGGFVALVAFALVALARTARVTSTVELDAWGQTVFRRTVGVVWSLFGGLFALHVLFWASGHSIALVAILPAAAMLLAWRVRSELSAWAIVTATMVLTVVAANEAFAFVALLATIALTLRAFGKVEVTYATNGAAEHGPYRVGEGATSGPTWATRLEPITAAARARLLAGALLSFYFAMWTAGWGHGSIWPSHSLMADAAMLILAIAIAVRVRPRLSLLVPAFGGAHAVVVSGLIPLPQSTLGWGSTALVLGFAILLGALATSYRLRRFTVPDA